MTDINIQRGVTDVPAGGTTTSITDIGSLTSAFVVLTNSRHVGAGDPLFTSNLEGDDMGVTAWLSATDTITFNHPSGSRTARVYWEVWSYTGATGGPDEFVVRDRQRIAIASGTDTTETLSTIPGSIDKCVPFITGVTTTQTSNSAHCMAVRAWCSGTNTLNVSRGGTTGTTTVAVCTVEFTGTSWSVGHGTVTGQTADSGTINLVTAAAGTGGSTFDVADWSTAFIASWGHAGDTVNQAIADLWPTLEPDTTTSVAYAFNAQHDGTDDDLTVHVLQHDFITVNRYSNTSNTAGATNVTITAVTDLAKAAVNGTVTSSGGGTAYGRGWRNYRLTSLTNVEHWCHRSGNTLAHRIQVINFDHNYTGPPAAHVTVDGVSVEVQVNSNRATLQDDPVLVVTGGSVQIRMSHSGGVWIDDTYTPGNHTLALPAQVATWQDVTVDRVTVV